MSRKLVIALFAFLTALTAWADPGGEGGCVNLPGGRSGSRPSSGAFSTTVLADKGVVFVLPAEMQKAPALVRGVALPFAFVMTPTDGMLPVSAAALSALRAAGETGFRLDFVNLLGERLEVHVTLEENNKLLVFVP